MMLNKKTKLLITMLMLLIATEKSYGLREARPTSVDSRLRVATYNPNDVFKFTGFYGYQSSIELAPGETVDQISMGDSVAWQIVPSGSRIFLKPMEQDATTNMTLITNMRTYYFELHAREADSINDPDLIFTVKFLYPDDENDFSGLRQFSSNSGGPDLTEPHKYNFNYTISGSDVIAPIKIFDDGEFSYFEFRNKNAEIPAFFMVNKDQTESLINYRIVGNYVVVERVAQKFTLRRGEEITCVFNESNPYWATK